MAYAYAYGTVVNIDTFFTVFENWIVNTVGWTLESGSGSQDLVLSSGGEFGDFTAFGESVYVRLYQGLAANDKYIFGQAYSDVVGTEITTADSSTCRVDCNAAGDSFDYWMAGDKDAFILVVKNLTTTLSNKLYLGTIIPYAKTKSSWQYFTIAGGVNARVLRKYDNTYNYAETVYDYQSIDITAVNELDGSGILFAEHLGTSSSLIGQLRHMTMRIRLAEVNALDRIRTGPPGSETEWIVLNWNNNNTWLFALRTNDQIPTGEYREAGFQYITGTASTTVNWFSILEAWLVSTIGWTVESGSGTEDIIYSSIGESGADSIFIRLRRSGTLLYGSVRDSAGGTHTTSEARLNFDPLYFPSTYHIAADKDCVCITIEKHDGECEPMWLGALEPFSRNLPSTPYKMLAYSEYNTTRYAYLLRKQQSAESWNFIAINDTITPPVMNNNIDPLIYYTLPIYFHQTSPLTALGSMKYMRKSASDYLSTFDTIQTGSHIYKQFYQGSTFGYWVMRIQ